MPKYEASEMWQDFMELMHYKERQTINLDAKHISFKGAMG